MVTEIEYNEKTYEVQFEIILGSYGDYFNPPEPPEINIESVVDEDGKEIKDYSVYSYADEEIYYRLNDGCFDHTD